ncbi:hypothetical protein DFP74_2331 [Nocardiopsis sp. Huas11]|uniref:hypothetical protein n=1 Tax=Nocardiopsis sp. Huas11 TaxID=2183912 RepID=UPI000F0F0BA9|nr:hypothetical protein [Nocardiopsis sp. Huas11]RKS06688.1 hypothetical protein DFP74_2331 [Nocardiopsis sp. Huas11]
MTKLSRWKELIVPALVMLVCLFASYDHLSSVTQEFGYSPWIAHPLAVALDAYLLYVMFLVWRHPRRRTFHVLLILGVLVTGSANFYAGYENGLVSALFSLVPILLIKAVYVALFSLAMTDRTVTVTATEKPNTFEEITAPLREELDEVRHLPQDLSDEDLRAHMSELDTEMKKRAKQYIQDNPEISARELARRFRRSQNWASERISKANTA